MSILYNKFMVIHMQNLSEMTKKDSLQYDLDKSFVTAMQDKDFALLVNQLKIPKEHAMKITSKLETIVEENKNCHNCKGFFMCQNSYQGHQIVPEKKEGRLYFSYKPCRFTQAVLDKEMARHVRVRMKDIDTSDKNQLKVIKWLDTFYENYDVTKPMKGLYLHGNFGSGKTYLLSALLNELAYNKNVDIEIVYFQDALRTLKEDWDNFSYLMHRYQTVDILLLDDIGAEKVTDWGRDEILGTILQARMEANKTTFFTSNLTIQELEQSLSLTNAKVDKVKSRRIIERIKQLSMEMALISENRRNQN